MISRFTILFTESLASMPIHLIAIDGCDYYSYAFFDASNSWRIHLLDGTNIFEGILQEEEIENGARDVGISIAEYKRMLKSAFAGEKTELVRILI